MKPWIALRVLLSVSTLATVSQAQVASNPAIQHYRDPQLQRRGPANG
jgi:hypothetical protein